MKNKGYTEHLHKLNTRNPVDIIEWVDAVYPIVKGICYYEDKQLKTKDPTKATFYFDPLHSVIEIRIKNNIEEEEYTG